MQIAPLLKKLSEARGVSGYEAEVREIVVEEFGRYANEVQTDKLGNVIALKRGEGEEPRRRIMLAGHMDEIGLMVTTLEKGFLRFTSVGGLDERTLLGQEVTVHGRRDLPGIIGSRPPHVLPKEEREKTIAMDKLFIDVGMGAEDLARLVRVGDLVTLRREFTQLQGDLVAGKALDDRTAVAAILVCLEGLASVRHAWDVYAVATVQEEVGLRGAITSAYGLAPDAAIAIDATFGNQPGVSEAETVEMGKGPAIAFGPNVHPRLYEALVEVAKGLEIPYQIEPVPGRSGTDAWAIQVTREGIPTALLSIPLRYMHTSVETVSLKDVERTGRLLAGFIGGLDGDFMEKLSWKLEACPEPGRRVGS
ncbi:MAG: M42 family metallopeptidase [Anaerolineae bacterium]|nr:M42 family metallopeptidase [Anaerolineae bacterium]